MRLQRTIFKTKIIMKKTKELAMEALEALWHEEFLAEQEAEYNEQQRRDDAETKLENETYYN